MPHKIEIIVNEFILDSFVKDPDLKGTIAGLIDTNGWRPLDETVKKAVVEYLKSTLEDE